MALGFTDVFEVAIGADLCATQEAIDFLEEVPEKLIYGGASLGLMECIARAVKENGGKVIGVVPAKLEENGKVSTLLDEEIHTRNLSDRKDIITEKSEVLVIITLQNELPKETLFV